MKDFGGQVRKTPARRRIGAACLAAASAALVDAGSAQTPPSPRQDSPQNSPPARPLTDEALSRMNQSPPPPLTSRDFVPAPPAPAPSPAVATDWTERYVVRAGDSLSGIAKKLYGDARRYPEIVAANRARLRRGHLIFPGQELVIPRRPAEPARNRP